jgi:histidine kinase
MGSMLLHRFFRHNLTTRLVAALGGILFLSMLLWSLLFVAFYPGFSFYPDLIRIFLIGICILIPPVLLGGVLFNKWIADPVSRLSDIAGMLVDGNKIDQAPVNAKDELGFLGQQLLRIEEAMTARQRFIKKEYEEYQNLFDLVPCLISVQDRDLRLIRYNKEFAEKFAPKPGDFCYSVYKGRTEKCEHCPVEKTFQDGQSHSFEEAGYNRDGEPIRWVARTAPIRDKKGRVVAAVEMSLDVTLRHQLAEKLKASESRYQAIFSNIPNPVFVLDPKNLMILDCNESVGPVYGFSREGLKGRSFLEFFDAGERENYALKIKDGAFIHQARHFNHEGRLLFVDIRASHTLYSDWEALLVTTSDITQQLETEQQLIQASKMTTLGEMATGIAHELNQPLSVMKTASSFILKKFETEQAVRPEVMATMLEKIDANVDRATNIIQHMRAFAHKSDLDLSLVDINDVLKMASDIFAAQLKLRGIDVIWETEENLPRVRGNPSRLEQVFINLLINARDAIEDRWGDKSTDSANRSITLTTRTERGCVVAEVCDTGTGIPDAMMGKIFEPFFTTKTVGKGTGLGLSISYGIIRDCGGTIAAANRKSGGACFRIDFPVPADKVADDSAKSQNNLASTT